MILILDDEPSTFHNLPLTWEEETALPSWLVGSYIKNGPSQKRFGSEERWYSQYMDSWGKLNKITFTQSGEVLFSGRMVETDGGGRTDGMDMALHILHLISQRHKYR